MQDLAACTGAPDHGPTDVCGKTEKKRRSVKKWPRCNTGVFFYCLTIYKLIYCFYGADRFRQIGGGVICRRNGSPYEPKNQNRQLNRAGRGIADRNRQQAVPGRIFRTRGSAAYSRQRASGCITQPSLSVGERCGEQYGQACEDDNFYHDLDRSSILRGSTNILTQIS